MAISLRSAMSEFSTRVFDRVVTKSNPSPALRQFFAEEVVGTRGYKFYVRRQGRPVAVSVSMHEKGIVTRLDKSTQKEFYPPYFNYKFDYSALEEFEPVMGATDEFVNNQIYAELARKTVDGVMENEERFQRAEQLQMMQALETGVVTIYGDQSSADIDFQRKTASLVPYAAGINWGDNAVNPGAVLITGAEFLITEGMVDGSMPFNLIAGVEAIEAFKNNDLRQKQGDIKDQIYMDLATGQPIRGLTPQGSYKAGNYHFNLWGLTDYYDAPGTGTTTSLMNSKKIIMLPNMVPFKMIYTATPGWEGDPYGPNATPRTIKAKRNTYELRDVENANIQLGLKSAFAPNLSEVDKVWTAQVVAP